MALAASFSRISLLTIWELFLTKRQQSKLRKKEDPSFLWLSNHGTFLVPWLLNKEKIRSQEREQRKAL